MAGLLSFTLHYVTGSDTIVSVHSIGGRVAMFYPRSYSAYPILVLSSFVSSTIYRIYPGVITSIPIIASQGGLRAFLLIPLYQSRL